jgi:hypothetical protein
MRDSEGNLKRAKIQDDLPVMICQCASESPFPASRASGFQPKAAHHSAGESSWHHYNDSAESVMMAFTP